MNLRGLGGLTGGCMVLAATTVPGFGDISLFDWALNRDGVISTTLPGGSVFNTGSGLGEIHLGFSGAGSHYGLLFVDHELSETVNTFFNEVGNVSAGSPSAGVSWEIDEPGFVSGDIYDNFAANTLDNTIGIPDPDDVSMALGWEFTLAANQEATLRFDLSTTRPTGGFYLIHNDPDSDESIFFSTSLTVRTLGEPVVPEAGTMAAAAALATLSLATWYSRGRRST